MTNLSQSWIPGRPARIAGLGVELRSLVPADIDEAFAAALRAPDIFGRLALGVDAEQITREFLLRMLAGFDNRHHFLFGVTAAGDGPRLGYAWARTDPAGVSLLTVAITDASRRHRGAGPAFTYVLASFLFNAVRVHKVSWRIYGDNPVPIRNSELMGWKREGVLREADIDANGGRRDIVLFGLLRSEFAGVAPPPAYEMR